MASRKGVDARKGTALRPPRALVAAKGRFLSGLCSMYGFELMGGMQSAGIPVIYLTAKADVISKVHGLRAGAEDYIVKPFEVLVLLAANKNVAFSREQLLNQVWGSDYMGETRTVDVHIGRLRKKLDFFEVIRTIPKTGYRLED